MYKSYLNFILRHVKFELVLEDFKHRQVINFEEVLRDVQGMDLTDLEEKFKDYAIQK